MKIILKIQILRSGNNKSKLFFQTSLSTPIGKLGLLADELFLLEISFHGIKSLSTKGQHNSSRFDKEIHQIREYFDGERKKFTINIKLETTPFTSEVLNVLKLIPYGTTTTYKEVAQDVQNTNASRAVGNACGRNPLPLIIPCHRVIASNGMGGFGGGLKRKKFLLDLESN